MTQGPLGHQYPPGGPPPNVMVQAPPPASVASGLPPHLHMDHIGNRMPHPQMMPGQSPVGPPPGPPQHPPMGLGPPGGPPIMEPYPPPPPPMGHMPQMPPCPPSMNMLEAKIYEMNRRLQVRIENPDETSAWWNTFAQDYFDDDASLSMEITLDDGPKCYTIGRTLIPRYFRSFFDGGLKDLYFVLRNPKREFFVPQLSMLRLDAENCLMVTIQDNAEIHTECKLMCDFTTEFIDFYYPRIKKWHMKIQGHQELVPREILRMLMKTQQEQQDNSMGQQGPNQMESLEPLKQDITRQGIPGVTLNYLRLCVILEPMQQLMAQEKLFKKHGLSPRDWLQRTLVQRFNANSIQAQQRPPPPVPISQPMMPPEPEPKPPKRKRSRKGSTTPTGSGGGKKKGSNASPAPTAGSNFALTSHVDVMVVNEPTMMGGECGDGDERVISRIENMSYEANLAAQQQQMMGPGGPLPPPGMQPPPGIPMGIQMQGPFDPNRPFRPEFPPGGPGGPLWPPSGPEGLHCRPPGIPMMGAGPMGQVPPGMPPFGVDPQQRNGTPQTPTSMPRVGTPQQSLANTLSGAFGDQEQKHKDEDDSGSMFVPTSD